MDAAETWLQQHDPEYLRSRQGWKHIDAETGEYEGPAQEIPAGDPDDLAGLVALGKGRYIDSVPHIRCEMCELDFIPQTPWHRFCSERCRNRVAKRRERAA